MTAPRLTRRGEHAAALGVLVALFLALWAASAIAYALTGVAG